MRKKSIFKVLGTALVLSMAVLLNPVQADATSIGGVTIPDIPGITGGNTGQDSGSSSGTSTVFSGTITSAPKNLKQTDSGTGSVSFSWSAATSNGTSLIPIYYYKQIAKDSSFTQIIDSKGPSDVYSRDSNTYTFSTGLDAGTTYYVRVGASYTYSATEIPEEITTNHHWSSPIEVVTAPSAKPTVKMTGATTTSVKLSWNAVSGANGYRVAYWKYLGETDSDAKTVTLTSTKTEIKKLTKNTKYSFRVYALRTSGTYTADGDYGQILGVGVLPTKVSGLKVTGFSQDPSLHRLTYEVDARESAATYQYEVYRYDGKKKIVSGKTTSVNPTINKNSLTNYKNTFLYIRVRAGVKLTSGKYIWGQWSNKYYFTRLDGTNVKLKKSGDGMKVSWKKENGATGYFIYIGRASNYTRNVTYRKVATISNGKTTSKKLSADLLKQKKVPFSPGKYYYVRVIPVKKVNKTTYKAVVESKTYNAYVWYTKDKKWRMYPAL